jgi:serine/threonine-protein kinase RsbW
LQDAGHCDDEFEAQVVSAFSEAFNNIVLHGYDGSAPGDIEVEIEPLPDGILIRIADTGTAFDPLDVPPPSLDRLPESGMGVFIIRSFMDAVQYVPGRPPERRNVLSLFKRARGAEPQRMEPA